MRRAWQTTFVVGGALLPLVILGAAACGSNGADTGQAPGIQVAGVVPLAPSVAAQPRAPRPYLAARPDQGPQRFDVSRRGAFDFSMHPAGKAGFTSHNAVKALDFDLGASAVTVRASAARRDPWDWSIELTGIGREGNVERVVGSEIDRVHDSRVEYKKRGAGGASVSEWYENGPAGLEQGFTIDAPPAHGGSVVLELRVNSSLRAIASADGKSLRFVNAAGASALEYSDLVVKDATGRVLSSSLAFENGTARIVIDDTAATYPLRVDPLIATAGQEVGPGLAANDDWGFSVAISGDYAVIGAPGVANGAMANAGEIEIYERGAGTWTFKASFAGVHANDVAGNSVAISGTTIVAGVPGYSDPARTNCGAVYIFTRSATLGWQYTQGFLGVLADDQLGVGVGISGDVILTGAPFVDIGGVDDGVVDFFTRSGATWSATTEYVGAIGSNAGAEVAVSGTTAVWGAPGALAGKGAFYVAELAAGTWGAAQSVSPADLNADSSFGVAIGIDGTRVVVGAPGLNVAGNQAAGGVYIFSKAGANWPVEAKLVRATPAANEGFGYDVALSGTTVAVGMPNAASGGSTDVGLVSLFSKPAATWNAESEFTSAAADQGWRYGNSVALDGTGTRLLVGANGADGTGTAIVYTVANVGNPADAGAGDSGVVAKDGGTTVTDGGGIPISDAGTVEAGGKPEAGTVPQDAGPKPTFDAAPPEEDSGPPIEPPPAPTRDAGTVKDSGSGGSADYTPTSDNSGCGCRTVVSEDGAGLGGVAFGVLFGVALVRRRRAGRR